jgi:hypothetical protein
MHRYAVFLRAHWRRTSIGLVLGGIVIFGAMSMIHLPKKPLVHDFTSCINAGFDASNDDPQTCSNGHETFAAALSAPAKTYASAPGTTADYTVLVTGDSKSTYPAATKAITSQADWVKFWNTIHAGIKPFPQLLPVDFTQDMVIAIVQGPVTMSGYSLQLTSILRNGADMEVAFVSYQPNAACASVPSPTDNYLLLSTPKVSGTVTFMPTLRSIKC